MSKSTDLICDISAYLHMADQCEALSEKVDTLWTNPRLISQICGALHHGSIDTASTGDAEVHAVLAPLAQHALSSVIPTARTALKARAVQLRAQAASLLPPLTDALTAPEGTPQPMTRTSLVSEG